MTGPLDREDVAVLFNIVRRHLRSPAPDMAAYQLAHRLEELLQDSTSANGSTKTPLHDDEWVTTTEAAKALGVTDRWVRELASIGDVGAVKRAGRWWIPRDAIPEEDSGG